ncbi:MAG: hypothetical protein HY011_08725 [Acidobacteria bacterium]|nr:hypothetical protein [Acidobacteriota bacterium]
MIAPKEYAENSGVKYQTVMLWLRQGLIPNAEKHPLPTGGHYYLIPADAPKPVTQRGPKPKGVAEGETAEQPEPNGATKLGAKKAASKPKAAATGKGVAKTKKGR